MAYSGTISDSDQRCMLGSARTCDAAGGRGMCARCGWRAGEANRRKALPMFLNARGLWQKRVGVRQAGKT